MAIDGAVSVRFPCGISAGSNSCATVARFGLQRLRGLIVICSGGPTLLEQSILPLEMVARLRQLTLRSDEVGLRRAQCVAFILRFQSRDDLSGLEAVSELAIVFEHATGDAECKRHLVLGFDPAGQGNRGAGCALLDRHSAHRARLWRCSICLR